MKVLYIVGLGRSGSTLVDILLDAHSGIQSLGGVRRLNHYAANRPCPCGAPDFGACPFWSRVDAELERRIGRSLTSVDVHARDHRRFAEHNRAVFEAAARVAGVDVVVDNSKSVGRLRRLMAVDGLEVLPIHVARDPRGRAQSLRKRNSRGYLPTLTYSHRSLRAFALLRDRPHIAVDYDRLAASPGTEVPKLMARIGVVFEPAQLRWAEARHHNIGSADVLRGSRGSTIRVDDAWERAMPPHARRIVSVLAWPGLVATRAKLRRWGL